LLQDYTQPHPTTICRLLQHVFEVTRTYVLSRWGNPANSEGFTEHYDLEHKRKKASKTKVSK